MEGYFIFIENRLEENWKVGFRFVLENSFLDMFKG